MVLLSDKYDYFDQKTSRFGVSNLTIPGRVGGQSSSRSPTTCVGRRRAGSACFCGRGRGKGMSSSSSASAVPPVDDVCSVCHDRFRIPCQANCSHWFCGECIIRVWHHGPAVQACKCPICRRLINLLVPANISEQQQDDPQRQRILREIQHYNHIFGGAPRTLTQRLQDMPFFIRRLFRELMDPQRTLPLVFRARMLTMIAMSAIYVVSPVDILPESVVGFFGYIDDLFILLIVFMHLAAVYRSLLVYRHGGQY